MNTKRIFYLTASTLLLSLLLTPLGPAADTGSNDRISVNWNKVIGVSRTTPTLQLGAFPPNRRGSKIHDQIFAALQDLRSRLCSLCSLAAFPQVGGC